MTDLGAIAETDQRYKRQMTLFADTKYLELLEAIAEVAYQYGKTRLDKYRRELIDLAEIYKEYHQ